MITEESPKESKLKQLLQTHVFAKMVEMVFVFFSAFVIIYLFLPLVEGDLVLTQLVVWIANIVMLLIVWAGLKIRGQRWSHFGLTGNAFHRDQIIKTVLLSLLVFVLAMAGFLIGSMIMANITGIPQQANMSGYSFLQDNFFMLLLVLVGVWIVSSFGEEVIYRAFLITRIEELGLSVKSGKIVVVLISAIIFGLAHYSWGLVGIVQTFCMGLVLSICYLKLNRRLWILILAHAYMDTILMVQMYLAGG